MPEETWDEATFQGYYSVRDSRRGSPTQGQYFTYGREYATLAQTPESDGIEFYDTRWSRIVSAFGVQPADRVLVVGAGFGFLIEAAKDAGFANVWGIDNSPYVAANRGAETRGDVVLVEDDVRGGGRIKAALRQATGDDVFDWVITEDVVACYSDADVVAFAPHLERLLAGSDPARVVHVTTVTRPESPPRPAGLTWHTLAEWAALVPAHSWMSTSGEVP